MISEVTLRGLSIFPLPNECFADGHQGVIKPSSSYKTGYFIMPFNSDNSNPQKLAHSEPESSEVSTNPNTATSTVQPLAPFEAEEDEINNKAEAVLEVFTERILDNTLETVEENPIKHWMDIAAPILKSGGKTVAIILALGFISIPLMVSGSPWVALVLAIGASITAISSCL